jgi:glycerophosphoryl diester phosphodiesterase
MPWRLRSLILLALTLAVGCASASPVPRVIAHRGASGLAPEHTLAAYDLAVELGADSIEQDLHLTRDGVLVVVHDETLDRTARGPAGSCSGLVREKTLAELERCDFGAWFDEGEPEAGGRFAGQRIVTLEALFRRYGTGVHYTIETKHPEYAPGMEKALLAQLDAHGLLAGEGAASRVTVQSFSPESLRLVRAQRPELPLLQLLHGDLGAPLDEVFAAVARYADGIGPHRSQVDAALMAAARRHGLLVHPYTVNERSEMVRLLDLGVDGMFTDRPDRLVGLLRER